MVQIFVTGGTFDKEYNYLTGELTFVNSNVPNMLKKGRCGIDVEVETLFLKDSLYITDEDRQLIAEACIKSSSDRILITHGTDTMVDTAMFLSSEVLLQHKTIVLTGAMIPYTFGASSDGFFNLGSALSFVQDKEHGVYVAMNGRCFDGHHVKKNYNTGFFEEI